MVFLFARVAESESKVEAPRLLIIDARSYAAAVANRAKGGGCECQGNIFRRYLWELKFSILKSRTPHFIGLSCYINIFSISLHLFLFTEYYGNAEIQFMNLANIHTIRKSFQALRNLCSSTPDQAKYGKKSNTFTNWKSSQLNRISGS